MRRSKIEALRWINTPTPVVLSSTNTRAAGPPADARRTACSAVESPGGAGIVPTPTHSSTARVMRSQETGLNLPSNIFNAGLAPSSQL